MAHQPAANHLTDEADRLRHIEQAKRKRAKEYFELQTGLFPAKHLPVVFVHGRFDPGPATKDQLVVALDPTCRLMRFRGAGTNPNWSAWEKYDPVVCEKKSRALLAKRNKFYSVREQAQKREAKAKQVVARLDFIRQAVKTIAYHGTAKKFRKHWFFDLPAQRGYEPWKGYLRFAENPQKRMWSPEERQRMYAQGVRAYSIQFNLVDERVRAFVSAEGAFTKLGSEWTYCHLLQGALLKMEAHLDAQGVRQKEIRSAEMMRLSNERKARLKREQGRE